MIVSRCSDREREQPSSMARRSRHTTAPTSRITRANQVSVMSCTVAPTYTCSRRPRREDLLESADQSEHRVRGTPGLAGDEVEIELLERAAWSAICSAASRGDDAEPRLGRRQGGDDVEPASAAERVPRRRSASSGVPHRWAYCSESLRRVPMPAPTASARVGQRLGDLAQRGAPRNDRHGLHRPRCGVSSRQHLVSIAPAPPVRFRGQMSTCGARSP